LRPQFLPSGRAIPEVALSWRVDDFIDDTKGSGKWTSVEERISKRKREGRQRRKLLEKHPKVEEETSYLTVDCDFLDSQEDPIVLPAKSMGISDESGFYFQESSTKLPIEGPMTLEEVQHLEWQRQKIEE
jgi:hypothetical protein